jgi:enamine deaminase RidA (YjgF/YER057c/UK114 family)
MIQQSEYSAGCDQPHNTFTNVMPYGTIEGGRCPAKISVIRADKEQAFLVASHREPVDAARAAAESYGQIAATLTRHRLEILHERVFCSQSVEKLVMAERSRALRGQGLSDSTPVTSIQGHPPWGEGLAGVIIHAVPATQVRTVLDGEIPCGRAWQNSGAELLVLQNITGVPADPGEEVSRGGQIRRMLDRTERILGEQGGSYRDVVRTWFYLADILEWYPEFNKVRNEKYGEFGIMPGPGDGSLLLPASTGIRGDTRSGAAAAMDLVAVIGNPSSRPVVTQLTNRGQLDAFRYGSAFSRGALIRGTGSSLFHLSGTAAIDERGKSLFIGDIRGQIGCTLDKVEALMAQTGASLSDVAAATVFVKQAGHAGVFWELADERGLAELPVVCVVADVCRGDLLFEIDAEAVVPVR